jgi:membrane-associated protease RseP (regulator of RpoE activity)
MGADLLVAAAPGEGAFEQKLRVTIKSTHFGFTEALELSPGSPRWTQELTKRLDARVPLSEPWLGMELIEAERVPNPIVLTVAAGGPAATAGIKQGEALVAIAGTATATPADAAKAIAGLREGAQISLSVQAPGGSPRQVNVKVASAPVMLRRGESTLATPVLAETLLLRSRTEGTAQPQGGVERTSALLTLADVLMRNNQHEAALTSALTPLQLPDGPGLSGGTVDYLRGACLLALGRKAEAAEALKKASRSQNSRLWSQDGPPVAEGAARLLETIH